MRFLRTFTWFRVGTANANDGARTVNRTGNLTMNDRYHNSINSLLASAIDLVRSAAKAIIREHKRWAAVRALSALDDRTLKDIGLHRSQIPSVVNELLASKAYSTPVVAPCNESIVATQDTGQATANDDEIESAA